MALTTPTTSTETSAASTEGATAIQTKRRGKPMAKGQLDSKASTSNSKKSDGKKASLAKAAGNLAKSETKASIVLKKLQSPKGVTIEALMEATAWQAHSVRGFLSAVVRKKLGLNLVSETGKDGVRRYRIDSISKAK
jgi:hypothetical protein